MRSAGKRSYVDKIAIYLILIVACLMLHAIDERVTRLLQWLRDFRIFIWSYIAWETLKYLITGLALSLPFLLISWLVHAHLFALGLILESKIGVCSLVEVPRPRIRMIPFLVKSGYVIYGILPLLVRLLSSLPSLEISTLTIYLMFMGTFTPLAPYIAMVLLPLIWLREHCAVREYSKDSTLKLPGKVIGLIIVLLVGVGSVFALAPIYFEILEIFGNPVLSLELFTYVVLIGYVPALGLTCGIFLGIRTLWVRLSNKPIESFERCVARVVRARVIYQSPQANALGSMFKGSKLSN